MVSHGHDAEFRQLFAEEAEQRLARLSQQVLKLEETGSDEELVASIFRDAHTLKGSAAMVGFDDIARVAHAMEDLLVQLRSGERLATPGLIDELLVAVDGLRTMIPAILDGHDRTADADALEQRLHGVAANMPVPDTTVAERPEAVSPSAVVASEVQPAEARHRRTESDTVVVPVPRLDELVRLVGESAAAHLRIGRMLSERLGVEPGTVAEFRDLSRVLNDLQERTMRARMVPVSTITDSLHRAARDLARSQGKSVRWEVRGGDTELDRSVLQQLADPLLHLVRNALDHGVETPTDRLAAGKPEHATLVLHAMQLGPEVIITLSDDGRGIDVAAVRDQATRRGDEAAGADDDEALYLIFRSGLSTSAFVSDVSGRGVGLDVVRANVEAVRGRIEVHSVIGSGSEFRIIVPITLAVLPCLLVGVGDQRYAIPMHSVVVSQATSRADEAHAEGRSMVWVDGTAIAVSDLASTLWGKNAESADGKGQVVALTGVTRKHAFRVDTLVGQRDVVVKTMGRLLPRLDIFAGASVEPDGSILLVLDAPGLIDRARMSRSAFHLTPIAEEVPPPQHGGRVLIVDDALTIRELERSILERAGYDVRTAADGVEALAALGELPCDLVLTDVEMPRMDGFALTEAIRASAALTNLPVLILTSRASEQDRQRGLEAGADGYIVKSAFDETALLAAIERILGRAT